ncbi:DBR1-domain-containing protein, partial [Sistotremastrum niveocremeum HHB9708]
KNQYKYRALGGFHKYYTGEKIAPVLTIVIGGNHEASNYFWELYHGGWLAPNIYYLGAAGCINVNGLRIAGASGIYNRAHRHLGYYERIPYDNSSMRSIYHVRDYATFKLSQLARSPNPVDIFMSHDWPTGIAHYGDLDGLLKKKPFFRADIEKGELGSPPMMDLLKELKPSWWFSAHMHVKFEAVVRHDGSAPQNFVTQKPAPQNPDEIMIDDDFDEEPPSKTVPEATPASNPDEIQMEDEEDEVEAQLVLDDPQTSRKASETRFLALDKCLQHRSFLEVLDIGDPLDDAQNVDLMYDSEWLAISRALHPYLSISRSQLPLPGHLEVASKISEALSWVQDNVGSSKRILDVQQFIPTAPGPGKENRPRHLQPPWYTNPQTETFCDMLGIPNKINPPPPGTQTEKETNPASEAASSTVPPGDTSMAGHAAPVPPVPEISKDDAATSMSV